MTSQLETVVTGFVAVSSSALGAKTAKLLAEVTAAPMPEWMTWLVGPLGALAGLVIALKWMSARLDRQEAKAEAKEAARDIEGRDERDRMIIALEQSTVVHHSVVTALQEVKLAIGSCQTKNTRTP